MEPLAALSTEVRNPRTHDLDARDALGILTALNDEDALAAGAVRAALPDVARLVDAAVAAVAGGARVHYFGAGTSGRLAVLDAAELLPTFSLEEGVVVAHLAGGDAALTHAVEDIEDSEESGAADAAGVGRGDVVLGIAASGRTPYVAGALRAARAAGATTALLACAASPALAPLADIVIVADTGPEALTGSTRLKAGTAQKMVLNGFSTALMVRLGRVHGNLMVAVAATNEKLRRRSERILAEITGLDAAACAAALSAAGGDLRVATVAALGGVSPADAGGALAAARGSVRAALASLAGSA